MHVQTAKRAGLVALVVSTVMVSAPAEADQASAHYHKAMALKRAGNRSAAIEALKKAINARSDYAAAHYSIGILYRQKGAYGQAISHLQQASHLDSKNGDIYYSLGLSYFKANRKAEALRALEKAAKLRPKDDRIVSQVGVLLIRKDPQRAIGYLKKAVAAKPNNADYLHQLGLAYRKATSRMTGPAFDSKRKRYLKEAEKYMLKAAARKESSKIEFDLGVLYRRMEKTDESIAHYEKATQLDPKMAPAFWDLGHMYGRAKRHDEAIAAYKTYLRLGGKDRSIARKRIRELKKR